MTGDATAATTVWRTTGGWAAGLGPTATRGIITEREREREREMGYRRPAGRTQIPPDSSWWEWRKHGCNKTSAGAAAAAEAATITNCEKPATKNCQCHGVGSCLWPDTDQLQLCYCNWFNVIDIHAVANDKPHLFTALCACNLLNDIFVWIGGLPGRRLRLPRTCSRDIVIM